MMNVPSSTAAMASAPRYAMRSSSAAGAQDLDPRQVEREQHPHVQGSSR